jgi:hypothetical protein
MIRRIPTDHIDSCHLPNEDDRDVPPSNQPTRPHSPTHHEGEGRYSSGTERTLAGDHHHDHRHASTKEKQISPEEREWADDIVT